ncbi:MAG: argininosuccinate lyase [Phycisphaerae bacterium]|nr:argininosuccinate lyase [Phycisphaerae bacterium]
MTQAPSTPSSPTPPPTASTALWAGRTEGKADDLFRRFNDSLVFDRTLVREDIEGSMAWAKALERAAVITSDERRSIIAALKDILSLVLVDPTVITQAADEDVHSWVERELIARVGELGKKLHTGRSRNDQVATDLRLWTARELLMRRAELKRLMQALLELAEREKHTVLPGYTHLQRAQPLLFAHWCLAYVEMFRRDSDRLRDALARVRISPLGSGALAGTAYPIDRDALAADLGFSTATANSLDAVSDRDFVVETLSAAALCAVHLSRLAEDLIFYATSEAGFVELPDAFTSGSSLMPQKKNPDALELLRGKTGRQIGNLITILVTLKGLPLAYNKDMQEDKEPLFDAMEQLSLCLQVLPPMLLGIKVDRERTLAAALGGYSNATDLADYLVRQGVPFREAHHQVGRIVRDAIVDHRNLDELSVETFQKHAPKVGSDVYIDLTIDASLGRRSVAGGTAPSSVESAIEKVRRMLRERAEGSPDGALELRQARMDDLDDICRLVDHWATKGENLPRSREDIMKAILDFGVALVDGQVVGCAALWIYTPQLAEVRSLGVDEAQQGRGVGQAIVDYFLDLAKDLHIPKVFVLTRAPKFFEKCGFRIVSINSLPEKVLKDCANCPKNTCCDETAMVRETGATMKARALPHVVTEGQR